LIIELFLSLVFPPVSSGAACCPVHPNERLSAGVGSKVPAKTGGKTGGTEGTAGAADAGGPEHWGIVGGFTREDRGKYFTKLWFSGTSDLFHGARQFVTFVTDIS
jgi:hypothetical protein